jgi:hypothetical protein
LFQIEHTKTGILHEDPNAILRESPPQIADYLPQRKIFLAQVIEKKEENLLPCTHLFLQSFGSSIKPAKLIAMLIMPSHKPFHF